MKTFKEISIIHFLLQTRKNLSLINLSREISGQEKFTSYQEYLDTEISDDFIIDAEIDLSLRILVDLIGVES